MSDELYRSILAGDEAAYYRVVLAQATKLISGKIRHPEGRSWNDSDALALASDYWVSKALTPVLLAATDDDSLNALVYTAIRNQVINRSRSGDRGRLLRRLKEILREEEHYVERPRGFWCRNTDPLIAYRGPRSPLLVAAWEVRDVTLIRWSPSAKRNSPVATRESFVSILDAVFEVARGAVDEGELAAVLAHRFGVADTSTMEVLDEQDELPGLDVSGSPEAVVVATEDYLEAVVSAVEIFGELSPDEQRMIPFVSAGARDAASELGIGKTKANGVQQRLKYKLGVLLAGVDEKQQLKILDELRGLM